MFKIHYFINNFLKIAKCKGISCPSAPTSDFSGLKLRDLLKLWFFKWIMTKSNIKNISYDVISVTSSLLHH